MWRHSINRTVNTHQAQYYTECNPIKELCHNICLYKAHNVSVIGEFPRSAPSDSLKYPNGFISHRADDDKSYLQQDTLSTELKQGDVRQDRSYTLCPL